MISIKSISNFSIPNIGDGFIIKNPIGYERDDCPYIDNQMEIDGNIYTVIGVESHAMCFISQGNEIGILVETKHK